MQGVAGSLDRAMSALTLDPCHDVGFQRARSKSSRRHCAQKSPLPDGSASCLTNRGHGPSGVAKVLPALALAGEPVCDMSLRSERGRKGGSEARIHRGAGRRASYHLKVTLSRRDYDGMAAATSLPRRPNQLRYPRSLRCIHASENGACGCEHHWLLAAERAGQLNAWPPRPPITTEQAEECQRGSHLIALCGHETK